MSEENLLDGGFARCGWEKKLGFVCIRPMGHGGNCRPEAAKGFSREPAAPETGCECEPPCRNAHPLITPEECDLCAWHREKSGRNDALCPRHQGAAKGWNLHMFDEPSGDDDQKSDAGARPSPKLEELKAGAALMSSVYGVAIGLRKIAETIGTIDPLQRPTALAPAVRGVAEGFVELGRMLALDVDEFEEAVGVHERPQTSTELDEKIVECVPAADHDRVVRLLKGLLRAMGQWVDPPEVMGDGFLIHKDLADEIREWVREQNR